MKHAVLGAIALTLGTWSCKDSSQRQSNAEGASRPSSAPSATQSTEGRDRFSTLLSLLSLPFDSPERTTRLYAAVEPICRSSEERQRFVASFAQEAALYNEGGADKARAALDVLEHVAVACARNDDIGAFRILAESATAAPTLARIGEIEAKIALGTNDRARAMSAARRAVALGSIHAVALLATVKAGHARELLGVERDRVLLDAIADVSIEPDSAWSVIDLTAVLTTRAHLFNERALWQNDEERKKTLGLAATVYERLSDQPFIERTRLHALDMRCFDAVERMESEEACTKARDAGILGAAFATDMAKARDKIDKERFSALSTFRGKVRAMKPGATVALVFRGDEPELVLWARPTARIAAWLRAMGARFVMIDRTSDGAGRRIGDRVAQLSGLVAVEHIDARRDPTATGCFAALVAKRKTPAGCPFSAELEKRLVGVREFSAAILVGRSLEAEIDDFRRYEHPILLLSLRQPALEKKHDAQLKSASDTLMFSIGADALWPP